MRILITSFLLCFFVSSYADQEPYKTYANVKYGVSFEYPSSATIEDLSQGESIKIWFNVEKPPVSGVLFEVKGTGGFDAFIEDERKNQEKYKSEMTEKKYKLGASTNGLEFVRDAKAIDKKMYYFVFPSLKENVVLSLWHLHDTTTGFMGNPDKEAKATNEYKHMIETLKLIK